MREREREKKRNKTFVLIRFNFIPDFGAKSVSMSGSFPKNKNDVTALILAVLICFNATVVGI